mmetsp:Transcript_13688/g.51178  ORF Transcript_13688/g.51178 Transcript_13688/m.51178 type:complete len:237 (+) Transcript_13688:573-1283(+)
MSIMEYHPGLVLYCCKSKRIPSSYLTNDYFFHLHLSCVENALPRVPSGKTRACRGGRAHRPRRRFFNRRRRNRPRFRVLNSDFRRQRNGFDVRFHLHQIWFGGFFARADWRPLRLGGRRELLQFGFPRGPFFRRRLFPRALLVLFQDFQDAHGLSTAPYPPKSALAQRAQHGHRGPAVSPRHCGGARELQLARHVCVGADTGARRVREPRGEREANKLVFRGRSQGIGAKRGEGRR